MSLESSSSRDVLYCEGCYGEIHGEPADTKTVPGLEGPITLLFCAKCERVMDL